VDNRCPDESIARPLGKVAAFDVLALGPAVAHGRWVPLPVGAGRVPAPLSVSRPASRSTSATSTATLFFGYADQDTQPADPRLNEEHTAPVQAHHSGFPASLERTIQAGAGKMRKALAGRASLGC
jgi:hypothetical protein